MQQKYDTLVSNKTWMLILCLPNDTMINCKWIYRVKNQADGSIERLKAHLVTNSMLQVEGANYNATFSPVVKAVLIHNVLTMAMSRGWHLNHVDISNAFL